VPTSKNMKHKLPILQDDRGIVLQAPTDIAVDQLAARLKRANNPAIQLLNMIGKSADGLIEQIPPKMRGQIDGLTVSALELAFAGASTGRRAGLRGNQWMQRAVTSSLGVVGGAGGIPSALAELPVTTTVLLHTIQTVAETHGFDPDREDVKKAAIQVFAAAGPLEDDDSADVGFLTARTTLTGTTVQALISRVAPRLSLVLGKKLAAQSAPVLGAVAGAAMNYAYTAYYQDMAHVSFGLRRLAEDSDQDYEVLREMLRARAARIT